MLGRALLALWWVPTTTVILLVLHVWWAIASRNEVAIQRGGAATIVFGILVATLPYWGQPFSVLVERAIPIRGGPYLASSSSTPVSERRNAARPKTSEDLLAERYLGVIVIVLGTVLNGYGDLFIKWLSLVP